MPKPSVIIIREQDEMVAACCVPFDGQFVRELNKGNLFDFMQLEIRTAGDLYRRLKEEFLDEVEVIMVDPRNALYLIPKLTKETFKNRIPFFQALKTIFFYRTPAVVCDGELLSSGQTILPESLLNTIRTKVRHKA